ncbi:MAG TPA: helix-turn-helix transcriptional regulator [Pyrinomonadaceae bacterium]|nr:helix-turn-helix transcriptional regulator [Pyrinomonadaceae bacterium]
MIEIRLEELLEERGRTFYWLAKETGISHTTLWRLKKGKALGINFDTLVTICRLLGCQPGDVLRLADDKKKARRRSVSGGKNKARLPKTGLPAD